MSERISPNHPPLPEGYYFEDPSRIDPYEVPVLLRQVEIGEFIGDNYIAGRATDPGFTDTSWLDVGVRDATGQLVGYGSIACKGQFGELCDFVVSPAHQSLGIGKAIIDERLVRAEQTGIEWLYMPWLEDTNTLKSYYIEKGFHETPRGELVRGPRYGVANGSRTKEFALTS